MTGHIVVAGNNTVDLCFRVKPFPTEGTKEQAEEFAALGGGQAANVAADLSILGAQVAFIADFGEDVFGALALRDLEESGVFLSYCRTAYGSPHAVAAVLVNQAKHERTIVGFRPPELNRVTPVWLVEKVFENAAAFSTDAVVFEQSLSLAKLAAARKIPVFSNLEEVVPRVHELLECVNYLIAPQEILAELAGGDSPSRIAALTSPRRVVIATCGAEGSWLLDHGRDFQTIPAVPCEVVDTTGAGDAYHAGFLYATLAGLLPLQACRYAALVASQVCTVFGSRLKPGMSIPLNLPKEGASSS